MSDENDEGKKEKLHVVNLQEKRKEKESGEAERPQLETKFCFRYKGDVINYEVTPCGKDSFDISFTAKRYVDHPFFGGKVVLPEILFRQHVGLSGLEKILNFFGFNFNLKSKVEKASLKHYNKIQAIIANEEEAKKITEKYKL